MRGWQEQVKHDWERWDLLLGTGPEGYLRAIAAVGMMAVVAAGVGAAIGEGNGTRPSEGGIYLWVGLLITQVCLLASKVIERRHNAREAEAATDGP